MWRRFHAAAFATLCLGLADTLLCGELLMQIFLVNNCDVPRDYLHKAIGIVFRALARRSSPSPIK
jgi:hypothetical protein